MLVEKRKTFRGEWVMGIEEGACWDEHWVSLYVSEESQEPTPKTKRHCIYCTLVDLTVNYIKKRKQGNIHKNHF